MSTEWGYRCVKHQVSTDTWLNHGEARLRELWERREDISSHREFMEFVDADLGRSLWFNWDALRFLEDHCDCPIELLNEYGDRVPIDEVPPCPAVLVVHGEELRCDIGAEHWGRHHHNGSRITADWS